MMQWHLTLTTTLLHHTRKILRRVSYLLFMTVLLTGLSSVVIQPVYANPTGGVVVGGQATITDAPNLTQIHQGSDKAIINWQGFSIGAAEKTQFIQPSSSSIALNRVVGNNPSAIYGQLTANGKIILVNPSGIVFGPTSRVDVAGLVATTANISNEDFMAGNLHFIQSPDSHGAVVNQGHIHIADHGLLALVAPAVQNSGVIEANLGRVTLGAGTEYTVDLFGDQLINFSIGSKVTTATYDADGNVMKDGVSNKGAIYADGGRVVLEAHVAKAVVDRAINMEGVAQARGVSVRGGEIVLLGGSEGVVRVAGKIDVSGKHAGQKGGKVKVLGNEVKIAETAHIDASGAAGGGEVLIGGNFQGKGPEQNARYTSVDEGAVIDASALEQGDGGKIIIWSDNGTAYEGKLLARGGALGGDGGFAEVSGKDFLQFRGEVDLRAPFGVTGELLLDPRDLTIQTAGTTTATASGSPTDTYTSNVDSSILTTADLTSALASANVTVQTGSSGSQFGDITVSNGFSWSTTNSLTLLAHRNIILNNSTSISNSAGATVNLHADSTGTGVGTISGTGTVSTSGLVNFYYNPVSFGTPTGFSGNVTGGGTPVEYMLVNNVTNLQAIGTGTNAQWNYALGKDIDASDTINWNTGAGFLPIGSGTIFSGKFEGFNHAVDKLYERAASSAGLFFQTNNATISNFRLTDVDIRGGSGAYTAGFASRADNSTFTNVYVSGTLSGHGIIGGIIGNDIGSHIINSHNAASLTSSLGDSGSGSGFIGGLAAVMQFGAAGALIQNSYNTGAITVSGLAADAHNVGGLVAWMLGGAGKIEKSFNAAPINITTTTQAYNVGGLVGLAADSATNQIYDSYNTGNIKVTSPSVENVAGGMGFTGGDVQRIFSTGAVVVSAADSDNITGLIGTISANGVTDSYWNTQTSGQVTGVGTGSSAGVTGKTTAQMKAQATFTGFTFDSSNWGIIEGVSYPYLRGIYSSTPQVISGIAYAVPTSTPVGVNNQVKIAENGVLIDTTTYTGADGSYYSLFANGTFAANDVALLYLESTTGDGYVGNTIVKFPNSADASITGLDIYRDNVRLRNDSTSPLTNTMLSTAKGAIVDSDILYSVSSGDVTVTTGKPFRVYSGSYGLDGDITAPAGIRFDGAVTLSADSQLSTTSSNITFNDVVNGGFFLRLTTTGSSIIDLQAVGNITPLSSLQVDFNSLNTTRLNGNITVSAFADFISPVSLLTDVTVSATGVSFGNVNGAHNLVLNATSAAVENAGSVTPLTSLSITAPNQTLFGTGAITTGAQTYNTPVLLQIFGTSVFTSTGGGNISFNQNLRSNSNIESATVNTAGVTSFSTVGSGLALANLTTDSAGSTSINGDITLTGNLNVAESVITLGANSIINVGSGNITLTGAVNGAQALTLNSTGTTTLGGIVGGGTPLVSLATNAGGTTRFGNNITTTSFQSFGDAVVLTGSPILTSNSSGNISFNGTLNGDGVLGRALTVNTAGTTLFSGVGGTTPLTTLTTNAAGSTSINGDITLTGDLTLADGIINLLSGATFDVGSAAITLSGSVDGAQSLLLNSTGLTTLSGIIGGSTPLTTLTTNPGGTTTVANSITVTGALTIGDPLTLLGGVSFSAGSGSISLSTVDGGQTLSLNSTGLTTLSGIIGGSSPLSSLTTNAGGTTLFGLAITTTGAQTFNDAVQLTGSPTLTSNSSGNISFNSTLNGDGVSGRSLTVNTSGTSLFSVVGGSVALTNLTTNAAGTTSINGNITLTGNLSLADAISLVTGATFDVGSGDITLGSTVNGAQALVLNSTGTTTLSGIIGGGTALTSLTTNAGGTTTVANNITTTGLLSIGDALSLLGGVSFSAGSGDITLGGTVNGAQTLSLNSTGTTTLSGIIGGTTPLSSLTTNVGGTTRFGNSITTTNAQTFNDAVVLTGSPALTSNSSGNITFAGTLNGDGVPGRTLNVNTAGTSSFSTVGAGTALTSLVTNAAGGTSINGNITTTGLLSLGDAITLVTGATFSAGSGDISLGSTVNGAQALVLNSTGTTTLSGIIGGGTALTSLTTNAGGTTTVANNITTTGLLSLGDAVSLTGPVILSGGDITLGGTVNGAQTLNLNSAGITTLSGIIGGSTPLTSLTTNTGGSTRFGLAITTTGAQTFNDAVVLTGTTTIASNSSGNISFGSTLMGDSEGTRSLTVNTAGTTSFGAVGGNSGQNAALFSLNTDAAGTTTLSGNIRTRDGLSTLADPINLTADVNFTALVAGSIALGSTVNGAHSLALIASNTGNITLGGVVGGVTPLTDFGFSVLSGSGFVANNITTTGTQSFAGNFVLTGSPTFTSTTSTVDFNGAINGNVGGRSLTVNAAGITSFVGAIGAGVPLANLTVAGAADVYGNNITLTGNLNLGGAVNLFGSGTATFSVGSGDITLGSTVNGAEALVLNSTGTTSLGGIIGGGTPLTSLNTNSGGTTNIGFAITTTGLQTFNDAVILTGSPTLTSNSSGAVTFASTLNGNSAGRSLTVNTSGATSFSTVGDSVALAGLTTNAAGTVSINGNITLTGNLNLAESALTLGGSSTVDVGSADITLGGTVNGAHALSLNSTGLTTFGGAIGAGTALASFSTNAGGTTNVGHNITTTGLLSLGDVVNLTGSAILSAGSGDITLGNTVNGAQALTLNSTGTTTLSGIIGGSTPLTSLMTNSGGTTRFGLAITTSGAQTFNDDVVLTAASPLLTSNSSGNISFNGLLNGDIAGRNLTVNTAGTSLFNLVGSTTPLASLTTDVAGTTSINNNITLTGNLNFADAIITLGGNSTINVGSADITLGGTVNGAQSLTLNSTGLTTLGNTIGAGTALASLVTNAGGTTSVGNNITTTGLLSLGDAVSLTGTVLFSAGSGDIILGGTVNGAQSLTLNSVGTTTLSGIIGGGTALTSFSTNAGGTTNLGNNITTTGLLSLGDVVNLTGAAILSAGSGDITLGNTVNGAQSLSLNSTGLTTLSGAIGGSTALTSFSTNAGGTTNLGNNISTTGLLSLGDAVNLTGGAIFSGGDITLVNTVNGAQALTLNSTGLTTLGGAIGGGTRLTSFVTDAGGTTQVGGNVSTTGLQTFNDAVVLATSPTFSSNSGGNITFANSLNGDGVLPRSVIINTSGVTSLQAVGTGAALASFATGAGGSVELNGDITTTGGQTFSDAVVLNSSPTLTSTSSGNITFNLGVNGAHDLVVNTSGLTTFGVAIGDVTPLHSLTTNAGGFTELSAPSIAATNGIAFNDIVNFNLDLTISNNSGAISFGDLLDGMHALTITGNSSNVVFSGAVGGLSPLTDVLINSAANVTLGNDLTVMGAFTQSSGTGTTNLGNTLHATGDVSITTNFITGTIDAPGAAISLNGLNGMLATVTGDSLLLNGQNGGTLTGSITQGVTIANIVPGASGFFTFNGILLNPAPVAPSSINISFLNIIAPLNAYEETTDYLLEWFDSIHKEKVKKQLDIDLLNYTLYEDEDEDVLH